MFSSARFQLVSAHSCSFRFPVRFSSFPACSVHLVRFPFVQFSFSSVQLVCFVSFSSFSACFVFAFVCTSVFIYIFSRILYTIKDEFQMYFLPKNMSFLRIVQIIDIKSKKFDASGHLFSHRPVIAEDDETAKKTGVDSAPPDRPPETARNGIRFPAAQKKTYPPRHQSRCRKRQKS